MTRAFLLLAVTGTRPLPDFANRSMGMDAGGCPARTAVEQVRSARTPTDNDDSVPLRDQRGRGGVAKGGTPLSAPVCRCRMSMSTGETTILASLLVSSRANSSDC